MTRGRASNIVGKPCAVGGKRKFRAKVEVFINNANNPAKVKAYRCPHCGFWHGTTKR